MHRFQGHNARINQPCDRNRIVQRSAFPAKYLFLGLAEEAHQIRKELGCLIAYLLHPVNDLRIAQYLAGNIQTHHRDWASAGKAYIRCIRIGDDIELCRWSYVTIGIRASHQDDLFDLRNNRRFHPHRHRQIGHARIGKNCKIFPGAVISAIPQDLKFQGEDTTVEIGDNTTLRECVTVNRGTAAKGKTIVGSNCLIMAYSHIAHDCVVGDNVIISNATQVAGEVIIDNYAVIGGGSLIHQFSHIGAHVMVQGGSLINKDIPPYIKAGRNPISYAGINSIGLRRRNFSNETICNIQEIYRYLYLSDMNNSDAIERIEAELPATKERDEIVLFVRNSKRGIIKGYL